MNSTGEGGARAQRTQTPIKDNTDRIKIDKNSRKRNRQGKNDSNKEIQTSPNRDSNQEIINRPNKDSNQKMMNSPNRDSKRETVNSQNKDSNGEKRKKTGEEEHQGKKRNNNRGKYGRNKETNTNNNFKIMYTNINGVRSKIDKLENVIIIEKPHVICLTETKTDSPPIIEGYNWEIKTRKGRRGGGVAILIRNDIETITEEPDLESTTAEIMWRGIKMNNNIYHIGVFYGKQETEKIETVQTEYNEITTQINQLKKDGRIILTGDFNAKIEIQNAKCKQEESRNGRMLHDMLGMTGLKIVSIENTTKGIWTRVNRHRENERSVIDYIITDEDTQKQIIMLEVDEEGNTRLDGRKKNDHNTIHMEIETKRQEKNIQTIERWKLNNKTDWKKFNEYVQTRSKNSEQLTYKELNTIIIEALTETVGIEKILIKNNKSTYPRHIRESIRQSKAAKKELKEKVKAGRNDETIDKDEINRISEKYKKRQLKALEQIEKHQTKRIRDMTNKIVQEGGTNSNTFWKIARRLKKKKRENYDIIDNNEQIIKEPMSAKEHVAKYFEDLYKPWPPTDEGITKLIQERNRNYEQNNIQIKEITMREMMKQKRKIKDRKAAGPDRIPNEIITHADKETLNIYRKVINHILTGKEQIPPEWKEGIITTIYKGKGKKGKLTNERGITMSSNMGKMAERIIADRIREKITITEQQAGGRKNIATSDHLTVIRNIIQHNKTKKLPTYITFLDVTKAYDKAWLDAIMYTLYQSGLTGGEWKITKELSNNLTARINTVHGKTRTININDSIRQGGVLSVIQYANLIDEVAKEIKESGLGCKQDNSDNIIGCLLWMDDIALIANKKEEMQKMLDITGNIATKYRIHFGKEKSNTMTVGTKNEIQVTLMNENLTPTAKYKYLGNTVNNKNNNTDQILSAKGKAEAAFQTILSMMGNKNFRKIEMEVAWKLIKSTIIPIITYAGESMILNEKEKNELNKILDNIIKRLLMIPQSTPREPIYLETGLLDIETTINKNKLMMLNRIARTGSKLMAPNLNEEDRTAWRKDIDRLLARYSIDINTLKTASKNQAKKLVKEAVTKEFRRELIRTALEKSKCKYYLNTADMRTDNDKTKYTNKLNRIEVSTIFKTKTRMIDTRTNYKGKYQDTRCRHCELHQETQEHILEKCKKLHKNDTNKVTQQDLTMTPGLLLRMTAEKIQNIMDRHLEEPPQ